MSDVAGSTSSVRVEKSGTVTTIVLARPAVKNAVDRATADALSAAFRAFDADPEANVAVLYGEGGMPPDGHARRSWPWAEVIGRTRITAAG